MLARALTRLIANGGTITVAPGVLAFRGDADIVGLLAEGVFALLTLENERTSRTCDLEQSLYFEECLTGAPATARTPRRSPIGR